MAIPLVLILVTSIAAQHRKIENEILPKDKLGAFKDGKKTVDWKQTQSNWDTIKLTTSLKQWSQKQQNEFSISNHYPVESAERTTYVHQTWMSSEVVEIKSHKQFTDRKPTNTSISDDSSPHPTTVSQYATFHSPMLSRPNNLLGPLQGPDWILDNSKLARKKALDATTGIEGTLLWAVGLFGTVQNGAIVVTGIFSHKFRQPLHILICTLAAADFFISFIYIPTYTYFLLEGAQPKVPLGGTKGNVSFWSFCNILHLTFIEIASVTLTIKVLISLYLYVLTYSKKVTEVIFSYRNTFVFIFLAWISNFGLLFVPNFLGLDSVDFYPNAVICIPKTAVSADDRVLMAYTLLTLSLHIAELLIISLCFSKVLRAIQLGCNIWGPKRKISPKKDMGKQEPANPNKCDIHYQRAKKITVLFFMSFVMCWLPIYLVNLVDPSHSSLPTLLHHFAMDMLLLKSAINPAIYVYGIRALRREMKVVCMCRCDRKGQGQQTFRTSMDSCPSKCDTTKSGQMV